MDKYQLLQHLGFKHIWIEKPPPSQTPEMITPAKNTEITEPVTKPKPDPNLNPKPKTNGEHTPRTTATATATATTKVSKSEWFIELRQKIAACENCPRSYKQQTEQIVIPIIDHGTQNADLIIIAPAPELDCDRKKQCITGTDNVLLINILAAANIPRKRVYFTNLLKCPGQEDINDENYLAQALACAPYLHEQIQTINPKAIICLGKLTAGALCNTNPNEINPDQPLIFKQIPVLYTPNLSQQKANIEAKKECWQTMLQLRKLLALPSETT